MNDIKKSAMNLVTSEEYYAFLDRIGISAGTRNCIFRGKNLGSSFTSEQKAAIANGTFKSLFIGDYWTINSVTYRIADFDYWLGTGDAKCNTHHVVVVPDEPLEIGIIMNTTNTTNGGYFGSAMIVNNKIGPVATKIYSAFGRSNILSHRNLFSNAVADGAPSGGIWADSTVDLMNEPMVYGSYMVSPSNNGKTNFYIMTIDKSQLSLFRIEPRFIRSNASQNWLRDVVSSSNFASISNYGYVNSTHASANGMGVRPAFGLKGA